MTGGHDLAQLLRDRRDDIVARFVAEVRRKDLAPAGIERSLLVDHIPRFLDEVVAALAHTGSVQPIRDASDASPPARQHGEQRWYLGYDLDALIREYGVLRQVLIDVAIEADARVSLREFNALSKCLNVGISEAAANYAKHRDEQVNARQTQLEFLAEAGQLLTSSLDYRSTLARLTGLVVPRLADWCAVHLDGVAPGDMAIAHVDPSKVALLRDMFTRFPQPADSPGGYAAAIRTREPQLFAKLESDVVKTWALNDEHLTLLRQINSCSLLVVPLGIQATMFGALCLGYSDSGRNYTEADLVFAVDLARRASVAIDNARLYELSQQERSRVEAATRAKDEFVAMVSHELRTPLNAILGWVRLMRAGALPEAKKAHAFEVIERNANAQNQLVGDLLDISRVITGKLRINPAQLDLANVIDMAVESVRPAADAKRLALEIEAAPGALLRGDGDRLQQVVWNLVANAVKFTPKSGTVRVRLRKVESDVEIVVEDTGQGIDAAFLPHVFDSFRQYDASAGRPYGGLGIGLSIAKHLVELHGGGIEARSEGLGRGATFIVRLPVSPLVSTTFGVSNPATLPTSPGAALPTGFGSIRVLVVDDEPDARELVAYVLESCGMEVRLAGSAAQALGLLATFTPSVIISDIGMPDEDGHFLIRAIRTFPVEDVKNIPAIALTAFARNEDRTKALVEGFNVHIAKPVEPTALVTAVIDLARASIPRVSRE